MKKLLTIFLVLIMVVSMSACAAPKNEEPDGGNPPPVEKPDDQDKTDNENNEGETKKEAEVNIYYTNEEYVITGNEDLERLKAEKRTVDYTEISLEEAVVRELLTEAKDEGLVNTIPTSVKLNEVTTKNGITYVDFAKEGMTGASTQEVLTIDQVLTSLLELENVNKVQFLLDGQVVDSLMGHVSTDQPFEDISQ